MVDKESIIQKKFFTANRSKNSTLTEGLYNLNYHEVDSNKTYLITGAAGFIGMWIIIRLNGSLIRQILLRYSSRICNNSKIYCL